MPRASFFLVLLACTFSAASFGCELREPESPVDKVLPPRIEIPAEQFRLPNGLEVILHVDHAAPIVAVRLNVRAGRASSPPDKPQVAHLVEHLMFAPYADGRRYVDVLSDVGAWNVGAETSSDVTSFHETAPRAALPTILWAEARRIGDHRELVDDSRFEHEQALTRNEVELRTKTAPGGNINAIVRQMLVPKDHPYRFDSNEEIASIAKINRADESAFFAEFYRPNHMTLVIAGDFVAKDALALVEKYFAGFEPSNVKPHAPPPAVALTANRTITIDADLERRRVVVAWVLPSAGAASLVEISLAGSYLAAVDKWPGLDGNGFAIERSRYASFGYYSMVLSPTTTSNQAIAHFETSLKNLTNDDVNPEIFVLVRAEALSARLFAFESVDARASILSAGAIFESDPAAPAREFLLARDAKRSDVRDAAYQFLLEKKRLIAIVAPSVHASRAGELRNEAEVPR